MLASGHGSRSVLGSSRGTGGGRPVGDLLHVIQNPTSWHSIGYLVITSATANLNSPVVRLMLFPWKGMNFLLFQGATSGYPKPIGYHKSYFGTAIPMGARLFPYLHSCYLFQKECTYVHTCTQKRIHRVKISNIFSDKLWYYLFFKWINEGKHLMEYVGVFCFCFFGRFAMSLSNPHHEPLVYSPGQLRSLDESVQIPSLQMAMWTGSRRICMYVKGRFPIWNYQTSHLALVY